MEMGTEENEAIVRGVCERVQAAAAAGEPIAARDQLIYDIDYLVMEANSGASYEQYFRWASPEEIGRVVAACRAVGLDEVAALTEQAIAVAFPDGIPSDPESMDDATDWSEAQEDQLQQLFGKLEDHNGRITNVLGRYASGSTPGVSEH